MKYLYRYEEIIENLLPQNLNLVTDTPTQLNITIPPASQNIDAPAIPFNNTPTNLFPLAPE